MNDKGGMPNFWGKSKKIVKIEISSILEIIKGFSGDENIDKKNQGSQ